MQKFLSLLGFFLILVTTIILLIFFIIDFNFFNFKKKLYSNFPNIELRTKIFNKKSVINNFENDYNIKFLPYTQFEKLNYKKKKINFENNLINSSKNDDKSISYKKYNSFFVDLYENKVLITDHSGHIYFFNQNKLLLDETNIFAKNIKNNLTATRVFDSFIYNNQIYVSYTLKDKECITINVSSAKLNFNQLNFKNFFNPKECSKTGSPGRIQLYKNKDTEGLLISTSEGIHDKPGKNVQNKSSIFGKILFVPLDGGKEIIYSSGHRVIQGLNVFNQKIISTEHGPRGGDEINFIENNGNYGWPDVSLGERYDFNYEKKKLFYKKDHKKNNFNEPIFSFIPSIGISEIIKLPNTFSVFYDDHYVLSSLNGRSIFLIRFNKDLNKVLSLEKVFINNRIRDIKYLKQFSSIILALEEDGEIGVLTKN